MATKDKGADLSPLSPLLVEKSEKLEYLGQKSKASNSKESDYKENSRMGKGTIIIGVIVGIVVIVAVVVPCVLLIPGSSSSSSSSPDADLPAFEFEDLYSGKYTSKSIYPNWDKSTEDPTDFITMSDDAVVRRFIKDPYNVDGTQEEIAPKSVKDDFKSDAGYVVSADAKYIAYRRNRQNVWRHSYTSDYDFWDVVAKKKVEFDFPSPIQHLEWSPMGHKLAIVYDFTVWMIEDLANPVLVKVSPDGSRNMDYYGIPDWMYEEEMISSNNVLYWNPSGSHMAFLHTNEEGVSQIEYTWYGDAQYPETIKIAYPKAGTKIGTAKLWIYDVTNTALDPIEMPAPTELLAGDHYFSRFTWRNDSSCLATWTNRAQTISMAQLCILSEDGMGLSCSTNAANKEDMNGEGWVGSFGPFYPLWRTGSGTDHDYFTIYTRNNADKTDGYWQLAYVAEESANLRWMTNTNYDMVGLNYYDSSSGYVYFTAAYDLPRRRHIMRVKWDAEDVTEPFCATCPLMDQYPDRCGWVSPVFADDGRSVVINCRGHMIPMTVYYEIDADGNWDNMVVLENNDELAQLVSEVKWPRREYRTYQSETYPDKTFNYEIWFPSDFDETKTYPLLIEVYAGIEFQKVQETWRRGFAQTYMVSGRDMIVASVDGRGSAYEGYKFMRENYRVLGQHEPEDQTDFAKYLGSLNYIDETKIAIWGWSYGGYTTSHTLGYDNGNTFKCGIAVAPLADWYWYDAMYAERYMGLPTASDNQDGYTKASIITGNTLTNFKNSEYTLIHGTADDNVHFQSAAEIEKALVEADVDFDAFFYADEAHSINSAKNANKHIYHQLDIRLSHCLGRVDSPYGGPN